MSSPVVTGALLRVVSPGQLDRDIAERDKIAAQIEDQRKQAIDAEELTGLASHIRGLFEQFSRHRNNATAGWSTRLVQSLRAFNGEYDPTKLADIRRFGGSEVYARITAMKCRGASSLLRDVYLSADRPWGLEPPDDPKIPEDILKTITSLVNGEVQSMSMMGEQVGVDKIRDRTAQLVEGARQAAKKRAAMQAKVAEEKIDEMLKNGGFYKALSEFITDLPLFPFAVMKGPVVRVLPEVTWESNQAVIKNVPKLTWTRVSPFDVWWTPGVSDIEDASILERIRFTRADLNDLLDLPGYNEDGIRAVLEEYGSGGLTDFIDTTDSERADQESRENPQMNQSGLITGLEFTGNIQGQMLLDEGMPKNKIPDPLRDYFVQAWLVGRHIIKVQLAPSPRKRHPYYITSFEKVPGTPVGNGLPDILSDVQESGNATLRALVNNMSIASGPQVVVNMDRIDAADNAQELFPWKRWMVNADPMGNHGSEKPIDFFQPDSNAQELLGVYQKFVDMADELSAIPKYLQGSGAGGGAGRTASGLAMLMGNASKILQTVAANIDNDVLDPLLDGLYDIIMLTDTSGLLTGSEQVRVLGATVAAQRETLRARQLEFLQLTNNPTDIQIMGPKGRAEVLRSVSRDIGIDGAKIVPSADDMEQQQKQAAAIADAQGTPGHGGMGEAAAAAQGNQPTPMNADMGPRTNVVSQGT